MSRLTVDFLLWLASGLLRAAVFLLLLAGVCAVTIGIVSVATGESGRFEVRAFVTGAALIVAACFLDRAAGCVPYPQKLAGPTQRGFDLTPVRPTGVEPAAIAGPDSGHLRR